MLFSLFMQIIVIGGGPAGFFAAIKAAEKGDSVLLLEKSNQLLTKVAISGGGRCNVTHHCFEPSELVHNYPRGSKALKGPFHHFQPKDTIAWFEKRGVKLKVEADGRMFPITDSSATIVNCLLDQAQGVEIRLLSEVVNIRPGFVVTLKNGDELKADKVLISTGSSKKMHALLEELGHTIVPPVPSLFTFNLLTPWSDLAGVSLKAVEARIEGLKSVLTGPCVITHWGFSGPALLKLSALEARALHEREYRGVLRLNWLPGVDVPGVLRAAKKSAKTVQGHCPFDLPKSLWRKLTEGIEGHFAQLKESELLLLAERLAASPFPFEGKSTNKEEFVTAGGVKLDEVNFKTMESKVCPGLYFAGEVLDIDGVTGGFNFQNAWTTGWIAGSAMTSPKSV